MIKLLLVDADSKIPDLAIMKMSSYYKSRGWDVELKRLNIPYYPCRKAVFHNIDVTPYDRAFASFIFNNTKDSVRFIGQIDLGGSGVDLKKVLPDVIEQCQPDYSLYPDNEFSYGFITRGCTRDCSFCIVREKEGEIKLVGKIKDIVRHKKVKFFDNNILSYPGHYDILSELVDKQIRCCFNQGLDIRLVDSENSELLRKMNYIGEYVFAFDNIKYKSIISKKLQLLKWRRPWQFKFFVYVHPDMKLSDTVRRIVWLKNHKIKPYIMRDIMCWSSDNQDFYTDIAAWCNQPHLFKNMTFKEFCLKRHKGYKDKSRTNESVRKWKESL